MLQAEYKLTSNPFVGKREDVSATCNEPPDIPVGSPERVTAMCSGTRRKRSGCSRPPWE